MCSHFVGTYRTKGITNVHLSNFQLIDVIICLLHARISIKMINIKLSTKLWTFVRWVMNICAYFAFCRFFLITLPMSSGNKLLSGRMLGSVGIITLKMIVRMMLTSILPHELWAACQSNTWPTSISFFDYLFIITANDNKIK